MSDVFKFELNSAGVRELLRSAEMEAGLKSIASGIASRCGDGYTSDTKQMGTRVIASVSTDSAEGYRDNIESNTILRNLK